VALIVVAACSGASQAPGTAPVAPLGSGATATDTLWDAGTFIIVDKAVVDPASEETFEIHKTASGYRLAIEWKRPIPTGEPADGKVTFETDAHFSPITGRDTMTLHAPSGIEVTTSTLQRDADGRLMTTSVAANGSKESAQSTGRNDFFIGGRLTTFLTALCQASPDLTAPIVYPDKATTLEPPRPLPIEGTTREVTYRVLTYTESKNRVVVACEGGKLAGEVTRGVTIVRKGDLKLAATLEHWFR
jgi:hypothetical protein